MQNGLTGFPVRVVSASLPGVCACGVARAKCCKSVFSGKNKTQLAIYSAQTVDCA